MRISKLHIVALGVALLFGCSRDKSPLHPNELSYSDGNSGPFGSGPEYDVYSVVVNSMFLSENQKLAVLLDSTVTYELTQNSVEYYKEHLVHLDNFIINDFNNNNKKRQKLSTIPGLNAINIFVSDKELDDIFRNGSWPEFYNRFPNSNGFVSLSSVGFSQKKDTAILYVFSIQGSFNAAAYIILLQKTNVWKVVKSLIIWIT